MSSDYPVKYILGKNLPHGKREYVSWLPVTDVLRGIYFKNEGMASVIYGKMFSDISANSISSCEKWR